MSGANRNSSLQIAVQSKTEGKARWFEDASLAGEERSLIIPAQKVIRSHNDFRDEIYRSISERSFATTKEALEHQIAIHSEPDFQTIKHEASAALNGGDWARRDYRAKRTHGARKLGSKALDFVATFSGFMSAYSGVIEVMKTAGQGYGEAAYECMSIFFVIMLNKSGNDTKMGETLDELKKAFPQMDVWVNIYPNLAMKKAVIQVYKNVTEFAREATKYFMKFWTRVWSAIGKPPSLFIDQKIAIINGSLAEVSSQANLLLHQRSFDIHTNVKDLKHENADLHSSVRKLNDLNEILVKASQRLEITNERLEQQNKDLQRTLEEQILIEAMQKLEEFKSQNKIQYPTDEAKIDICNQSLKEAFDLGRHSPGQMRTNHYKKMTLEILLSCEIFQSWHSAPESSLLVYSGSTSMESRTSFGYTHSWISPAAIAVAEMFRDEGQTVAFFSCHCGVRAEPYTAREVFLSIVYQVLQQEPRILRHKHAHFKALVEKHIHGEPDDDDDDRDRYGPKDAATLFPFRTMLKEILAEMKRPVAIMFDRLEQVDCALQGMLEGLIDLVTTDGGACVKIMVVIDSAGGKWNKTGDWDVEASLSRAEKREAARARVKARLDWDQEILSP